MIDCAGVVEEIWFWQLDQARGGLEREKHLKSLGDYYDNSFEKKKWPYATKRAEVSSAHLSLKVVTR